MVDQKTIDRAEVARVLALEEGHFLELKRIEIGAAKLSETISAFGNAAGGRCLSESGSRPTRKAVFGTVSAHPKTLMEYSK
jgi:hypothetical protein